MGGENGVGFCWGKRKKQKGRDLAPNFNWGTRPSITCANPQGGVKTEKKKHASMEA